MTDKRCPFCGMQLEHLRDDIFMCPSGSGFCEISQRVYCDLDTWDVITVLQKKLDKAMAFLHKSANAFEQAKNFGVLAQDFKREIKEIEDIRE